MKRRTSKVIAHIYACTLRNKLVYNRRIVVFARTENRRFTVCIFCLRICAFLNHCGDCTFKTPFRRIVKGSISASVSSNDCLRSQKPVHYRTACIERKAKRRFIARIRCKNICIFCKQQFAKFLPVFKDGKVKRSISVCVAHINVVRKAEDILNFIKRCVLNDCNV